MNYKTLWTSEAYNDFVRIVSYLKEEWSLTEVEEFINNLNTRINLLSIFPKLGKIINPLKQIRALILSKQVTLVYRIKYHDVIILKLFDTRQNPDKLRVNENTINYSAGI